MGNIKKNSDQTTVNPDWKAFEQKLEALKQGKGGKEDWELLRPLFAGYLRMLLQDLEKQARSLEPDGSKHSD